MLINDIFIFHNFHFVTNNNNEKIFCIIDYEIILINLAKYFAKNQTFLPT